LFARRPLLGIEPGRDHDHAKRPEHSVLAELAAGSSGEHKLAILPPYPSPRLLGCLPQLVLA
jgi:hypothetical protein